jgi:hypothetical protein
MRSRLPARIPVSRDHISPVLSHTPIHCRRLLRHWRRVSLFKAALGGDNWYEARPPHRAEIGTLRW